VTVAGAPVVSFKVTDANGNPVVGLGNTAKSSTATVANLTNLAFSLAKMVPGTNGSPAKWVSYIVTSVPTTTAAAAPSKPTTDNTGTLVDNKDGTYTYTFYRDVTKVKDQVAGMTVTAPNNTADLGDLSFQPTLVHRLTIAVSGSAPGTGTNTPTGATSAYAAVVMTAPTEGIYDFVPSTGAKATASGRDVVATAKCNECHTQLGGIPGDTTATAGFHGGNRNDTKYCVVCHTEQRKYGTTEATYNASTLTMTGSTNRIDDRAVGNFPNYIHKLHGGQMLAKQGYNWNNLNFNAMGYPQDIRNCTKCHDGSSTSTAQTAQGDNWKTAPSRLACGSCHDGINFATGTGVKLADAANGATSSAYAHPAGPQADDSMCALCHTSSAIDVVHTPVTPPAAGNSLLAGGTNANTNAAWIASNTSRLPAGAIPVSYDIQSVSLNSSRQPVMVFRILQNGARADFNVFNASQPVASQEIWTNFVGSPSVYFVFAVPQDGIATPADFNASVSSYVRSLWNGTASGTGAGTLTGPDANGYYTATLTGVTIPTTAVMLTGGVGYSYNVLTSLPLTQTNLAAYPTAPATATSGLTASMPNVTGGLIVIAPNAQKVATGFTGRRAIVEDARCNSCHQELGTFTEDAFHAGQRNDGASCSWCHNPNQNNSGWSGDSTSYIHAIHGSGKRSVPFTWHAASATSNYQSVVFPGVLKDCETCHLPGTYDFSASASASALPNRLFRTTATGTISAGYASAPSQYVTYGTNYGTAFKYAASTTGGTTTAASATTLVNSPITTACAACHDTALATAHMSANGGSFYVARGTALNSTETCMVCHATGRVADIAAMHAK
jgi:OmcA/MtrC family decaheme c-type cytochrome